MAYMLETFMSLRSDKPVFRYKRVNRLNEILNELSTEINDNEIQHIREILRKKNLSEVCNLDSNTLEKLQFEYQKNKRKTEHDLCCTCPILLRDDAEDDDPEDEACLYEFPGIPFFSGWRLLRKLKGSRPVIFEANVKSQILEKFHLIDKTYDSLFLNRICFLNYIYLLYKILELLELYDVLLLFDKGGMPKLVIHDQIWKKICEQLDWNFIPSM